MPDIHDISWPATEQVNIGQSSQPNALRNIPLIQRFGEVALVIVNGYMTVRGAPAGKNSRIVFNLTFNGVHNPAWVLDLTNAYYHRVFRTFIVALPEDRDIHFRITPELISSPNQGAILIQEGFNIRAYTDGSHLTENEIEELTPEDRTTLVNAGYITIQN